MAVQYIQNKNNPLGTLGSLAMIGGTLMGNPFLSALGTGIGAASSIMNGNANADSVSSLQNALKGVLGGWVNPASGNIARPGDDSQILDYLRRHGGV